MRRAVSRYRRHAPEPESPPRTTASPPRISRHSGDSSRRSARAWVSLDTRRAAPRAASTPFGPCRDSPSGSRHRLLRPANRAAGSACGAFVSADRPVEAATRGSTPTRCRRWSTGSARRRDAGDESRTRRRSPVPWDGRAWPVVAPMARADNGNRNSGSAPTAADVDWGRPARAVENGNHGRRTIEQASWEIAATAAPSGSCCAAAALGLASAGGTVARATALNRGIDDAGSWPKRAVGSRGGTAATDARRDGVP